MDKVTDISMARDVMIVIKVLVIGIIISVILVYAPQCDVDDILKINFNNILINVAIKLREKVIVVVAGDFSVHTGSVISSTKG